MYLEFLKKRGYSDRKKAPVFPDSEIWTAFLLPDVGWGEVQENHGD